MVATVVCHHILGLEHAHVRDTSVATMTKLVDKTLGGPEYGRIVCTCPNSAIWIKLSKNTELLVRSRLKVSVVEGDTKGIDVGGQDRGVGVRNSRQRDLNLRWFRFKNTWMFVVRLRRKSWRRGRSCRWSGWWRGGRWSGLG